MNPLRTALAALHASTLALMVGWIAAAVPVGLLWTVGHLQPVLAAWALAGLALNPAIVLTAVPVGLAARGGHLASQRAMALWTRPLPRLAAR